MSEKTTEDLVLIALEEAARICDEHNKSLADFADKRSDDIEGVLAALGFVQCAYQSAGSKLLQVVEDLKTALNAEEPETTDTPITN